MAIADRRRRYIRLFTSDCEDLLGVSVRLRGRHRSNQAFHASWRQRQLGGSLAHALAMGSLSLERRGGIITTKEEKDTKGGGSPPGCRDGVYGCELEVHRALGLRALKLGLLFFFVPFVSFVVLTPPRRANAPKPQAASGRPYSARR